MSRRDGFEANLGGIENPDFEDGDPWIADVDTLAADLAAAYGATPEEAGRAIAASFGWPYQPEASYGIIIAFRWWERPRRLWARKAKTRTLEDLDLTIGEEQVHLEVTTKIDPRGWT